MNVKNGHSGMNVNKFGVGFFALMLLATGVSAAAEAPAAAPASPFVPVLNDDKAPVDAAAGRKTPLNYTAPALYGLREITVQYPVFADPRATSDCGVDREVLLTVVQRNLQDPNLEVIVLDDKRPRKGSRADLTYEVYTTKADQTCFSWVSMRYTDQASIVLAPLKIPRTMTITFWSKSLLARSGMDRHQAAVGDALATMVRQFLRDVKLAEPTSYSSINTTPDMSDEDLKAEKERQMMQSINDSVSRRLINQGGGGADLPGVNTQPAPKPQDDQP